MAGGIGGIGLIIDVTEWKVPNNNQFFFLFTSQYIYNGSNSL